VAIRVRKNRELERGSTPANSLRKSAEPHEEGIEPRKVGHNFGPPNV